MMTLHRARIALLAAVVVSLFTMVAWLPLSLLVGQHHELASLSSSLRSIESRNKAMRTDVAALSTDSVIETIAHQEYGLVKPGEHAYVILPKAGSSATSGLDPTAIPADDLVPAAQESFPSPTPGAPEPGFWSRFVDRLEFWRGSSS
jgi:cell division protein FtsB